jgi:murein DD-endopeptidase MepM/ murein hydrolase activator NlpD
MLKKRYTILIADRSTGATRRFTISARVLIVVGGLCTSVVTVPLLVGLGARWSASVEVTQLRLANRALGQENDSYRQATGELTTQISTLQEMVRVLRDEGAIDASQQKAIANLPARVRHRAMGGAAPAATRTLLTAFSSPEDTFGVLRDLLGVLENRLQLVRHDIQRSHALAGATPSIWPVIGWLSDGFGTRRDPFTGEPAQHLGLDIAADKGEPVYATANGTVHSAGRHGDYGNLVVVAHEFGLQTRYAHLSKLAVIPGDRVERGSLVGYVGSTGRSTAPHLHYEVWANGQPLNPLKLLTR